MGPRRMQPVRPPLGLSGAFSGRLLELTAWFDDLSRSRKEGLIRRARSRVAQESPIGASAGVAAEGDILLLLVKDDGVDDRLSIRIDQDEGLSARAELEIRMVRPLRAIIVRQENQVLAGSDADPRRDF